MTGCDFDWMVSNHAVSGWKAPVKGSVSGVSLLQLSLFFASIFPLFPQKRLILRLYQSRKTSRIFLKDVMELKHESITLSSLVRRALNLTCSILICFSREDGGVLGLAPGFLRSLYRSVQGILRSLIFLKTCGKIIQIAPADC